VKERKNKAKRTKKEPLYIPALSIPYISSAFTKDIKRAVQRSNLNVRIVQRPQRSLKSLQVESRPNDKECKNAKKCPICRTSSSPIKCSQKDTLYQLSCDLCGASYIGETSIDHYSGPISGTLPLCSKPNCKIV
jgi:hypothetical protein